MSVINEFFFCLRWVSYLQPFFTSSFVFNLNGFIYIEINKCRKIPTPCLLLPDNYVKNSLPRIFKLSRWKFDVWQVKFFTPKTDSAEKNHELNSRQLKIKIKLAKNWGIFRSASRMSLSKKSNWWQILRQNVVEKNMKLNFEQSKSQIWI